MPTRETIADLTTCIARAKAETRPHLDAARPAILQLFDHYRDENGWDFDHVHDLTHLTDEVRKAMRASYSLTYKGRALAGLRAELLNVDDRLCPYCRLEEPLTLDHFLPKSAHEPFATFALNLIPMCNTCNNLKGTKGSKHARQFFTHAYFDELPRDGAFLIAQVAVGARHIATNFLIDFSVEIDASISQRLAYQMSVLRLVQRYQIAAIPVIIEQAEKIRDMKEGGCDPHTCRYSIERDAETEGSHFGRSYWKAALLFALAANQDFYTEGYSRALDLPQI